jgi:hypothetical protein
MKDKIEVKSGSWQLVVGPRTILPTLLRLTASLAEEGLPATQAEGGGQRPSRPGVRVVDGGNVYNVYPVARAVRGRPEVLERIRLSRAFSCYQMRAMLESLVSELSAPAPRAPHPGGFGEFVILDFLRTFYDESVQAGERKRLLRQCLAHLDRLVASSSGENPSRPPGGLVSVHPPRVPSQTARELLDMMTHAARDIYRVETPPPPPIPLRLF